MRLISFLTTALTIARIRQMLLNDERLNADLRAALEEVRELRSRIADPETFDS